MKHVMVNSILSIKLSWLDGSRFQLPLFFVTCALVFALMLALSFPAIADDPHFVENESVGDMSELWFMGADIDQSRTKCVGNLSSLLCAAETTLACRTWNDDQLCENISWPNLVRSWVSLNQPMFTPAVPYQLPFFYSDRHFNAKGPLIGGLVLENIPADLDLFGVLPGDRYIDFYRYVCRPELGCPTDGKIHALDCDWEVLCGTNPTMIGVTSVFMRQDRLGLWRTVAVFEHHTTSFGATKGPPVPSIYEQVSSQTCVGGANTPICALWRQFASYATTYTLVNDEENGTLVEGDDQAKIRLLLAGYWPLSPAFLHHPRAQLSESSDVSVTNDTGSSPMREAWSIDDTVVSFFICDPNLGFECMTNMTDWLHQGAFVGITRQTPDGTWRAIDHFTLWNTR